MLGWARWHESRRLVSLSVMPCTGRAGLSGPERDGWCVSMNRASTIRAGQHDPDCGGWGKCLGGCRVLVDAVMDAVPSSEWVWLAGLNGERLA